MYEIWYQMGGRKVFTENNIKDARAAAWAAYYSAKDLQDAELLAEYGEAARIATVLDVEADRIVYATPANPRKQYRTI